MNPFPFIPGSESFGVDVFLLHVGDFHLDELSFDGISAVDSHFVVHLRAVELGAGDGVVG